MTDKNIVWRGCVVSNVGLKRSNNEDNFLLDGYINENALCTDKKQLDEKQKNTRWQCAGIFDGMGGGENGELASYLTAFELRKSLKGLRKATSEQTIEKIVRQSFLNANQRIVEERSRRSILGTTATVICFRQNRVKIFHLGDSRAYLLRDDRLFQISSDQTLATLRIAAGCYGVFSPEADRDSHFLTEYVGADDTLVSISPVESEWITVRPKDKILLCSDGLYRGCRDTKMKELMRAGNSPADLAEMMTCQALLNGGDDNITCMVLTAEQAHLQAGGDKDGN